LWLREKSRCVKTIEKAYDSPIKSIIFNENYGLISCNCSSDSSIKIWDTKNGTCTKSLKTNGANVFHINENSNEIVCGSLNGSISVFNLNTGECLTTFKAHSNTIVCFYGLKKSQRLASGSDDSSIKNWYFS
jgi:WD40 repeat protein